MSSSSKRRRAAGVGLNRPAPEHERPVLRLDAAGRREAARAIAEGGYLNETTPPRQRQFCALVFGGEVAPW